MIVTTVNGTKFRINYSQKTWERIEATGDSGNLRSESGQFISAEMNDYGCFAIICPPFVEGTSARAIVTSPVKSIEEES